MERVHEGAPRRRRARRRERGRELCGNQPAGSSGHGDDVASMAWKLHAIEQTQLRRKSRVDGVGRPKFDFHTGRLAAGGPDGVRVWDLDNEERRPIGFAGQATVDGMASLKDGTLASGDDDGTIRVHRVKTYEYYREILRVTEDVARKWFAEDRLGELFDASVLQYDELLTIDDDDAPTGLGAVASRAVVTQARNLDAIATTLKSAPASRRDACIDDLAPRVLRLVKDEELLLTFEQRLVSKSAVEQLTPSPLFRVVLNLKG